MDAPQAMTTTFNLLDASRAAGDEASSECSKAILFLSDGTITQGLGKYNNTLEIVEHVEDLNAEIEAQIFSFALGSDADEVSGSRLIPSAYELEWG